jgi:uncharacterized protein (DUF2342 family)
MIKFYTNKDWLIEQYLNQKKSARQIGKEYNIGKTTIQEQLKKFNIPRRTISEANKGNKNNQWKGDNAGIIALHMENINEILTIINGYVEDVTWNQMEE